MELLHEEGDAKNFQNSGQNLLTNISHPHFSPLKIEVSSSSFTYF